MDESDKENLCTIPEEGAGEPSLCKEMPAQPRRSRKAGGCNLRKSLAWNRAFFTEEGVLDLVELSTLSGSIADSGQKPLSGIDGGGKSPLMEFNLDSGRLLSCCPKGKSRGKGNPGNPEHQRKGTGSRELFPRSEALEYAETSVRMVTGVIPEAKGIPRNLPRAPAVYSQKRVANVITTNQTSKIPKFLPTKLPAASRSTPSFDVMSTAKNTKSKLRVAEAKLQQSAGSRISFSTKDSAFSSSLAQSLMHDTDKHMVDRSTSVLNEPLLWGSSSNVLSTLPQRFNNVSGGPAAPVHAKPTALRMPSLALGFFSQGKNSPSYSNQLHRNLKPSNSSIPLRKDSDAHDLNHLHKSNGRKNLTVMATAKPNSEGVISRSIRASSVANCSDLSAATLDAYKAAKTNLAMKQVNENDQSSALEQLQESSCRKLSADMIKEVPSECSNLLQMNDEPVAEENNRLTKKTLKIIPAEDVHDTDLPVRDTSKNEFPSSNFSSQILFEKKLEESYLKQQEGGSGLDNAIENTQVRDEKFSGSTTAESSLRSIEDQSMHYDLSSSKPEYSLVNQTGSPVETVPGTPNISAEFQLEVSEDHSQDGRLRNEKKEGALMLDKERVSDKSKLDVIALKCHLNVVPFSDEWFAAVETFGEDLLELKTGPVQNSPTDKAAPEPGPWSPVRRRAQDIGPFDCTKYLKNESAIP